MCRDPVRVLVVRRVLHGAEIPDLVLLRDDDKAARVLARGALDAHTACSKAVFLCLADGHIALGQIFFRVPVGRFLGHRADGACTEHMVRAEHLHAVRVRARLILAGKVEVDIGDFVTAEAEERLKRNVEAVLVELLPALGAYRVGQIRAARAVGRHVESCKLALGAAIVRRKRVDLGDARQKRHDR